MRTGILVALLGTVAFTPAAGAQGSTTPSAAKKAAAGKGKSIIGQIADTAITSAAAVATDTLLGEHAGFVAAALNASGAPSCPAGLMAMPAQLLAPAGMAGMPGVPSAGSAIVGLAKGKLGGKTAAATEVAGAAAASKVTGGGAAAAGQAQYMCGTPEQVSAAMQAAQSAGPDGGGGAGVAGAAAQAAAMSGALKYTPIGGAIAAAPVAGAAAKKLGGMFGKGGQSAESMKKDLGKGRLVVQKIKFVEGGNEMQDGYEEEIGKLAQALASTEGQFVIRVPVEASGEAEGDGLARARTARVYAHLLLNGVPASRLARSEPGGKPAKKGDARIEIVAAAPAEP